MGIPNNTFLIPENFKFRVLLLDMGTYSYPEKQQHVSTLAKQYIFAYINSQKGLNNSC